MQGRPEEYATMSRSRHASRFRLSRRLAALCAAAGVCALTLGVATVASAGLIPSCAARPTSQVFQPWGDRNWYFMMPDGGFEAGGVGWRLSDGASVVAG